MYESPITKFYGDISHQLAKQEDENYMYAIKQTVGYSVDKEELIKALRYDRNQYEKGYDDAMSVIEDIKSEIKSKLITHGQVIEGEYFADDAESINFAVSQVLNIIDRHISSVKMEANRMDSFKQGLHDMFDHIWDCEIEHPVFQDTVGDLMQGVMQLYDTTTQQKMGQWIYGCSNDMGYSEDYDMTCGVCGKSMLKNDYIYCPYCGRLNYTPYTEPAPISSKRVVDFEKGVIRYASAKEVEE